MKRFSAVFTLFLSIVLAAPAWGAPVATGKFSDIIVKGPYIDSRAYGTLVAADAAAVAAGKELWITKNYTISSPVILSSHVKVLPGGGFTRSGGGTLALNGGFSCPEDHQAFVGFDSGGLTGLKEVKIGWFGVNTTPGTTDMKSAFIAAVTAVKPNADAVINHGSSPLTNGRVVLKHGTKYGVSGSFPLYSGMELVGGGSGTNITTLAGFSDPHIIELKFATDYFTHAFSKISGLRFTAPSGSAIAAIGVSSTEPLNASGIINILNCDWSGLYFDIPRGARLVRMESGINRVYTQALRGYQWFSFGYLDQLLLFSGNENWFEKIDTEGGSGTTTEPVIHQTLFYWPPTPSDPVGGSANTYRDIILEDTGHTNKPQIKIEKGLNVTFDNLWIETTNNPASGVIDISGVTGATFAGETRLPGGGKIKIRNSTVQIDIMRVLGGSVFEEQWFSMIDKDVPSTVDIDTLLSGNTSFNLIPLIPGLNIKRVVLGNVLNDFISGNNNYLGWSVNVSTEISGEGNLIGNGLWDLGVNGVGGYSGVTGFQGWEVDGHAPSTQEVLPSEFGYGNMAHLAYSEAGAPTSMRYYFPVNAGMVGKPLQVSVPIKITGAKADAYPELQAMGIVQNNNLTASNSNTYLTALHEKWILCRKDLTPQSQTGTAYLEITIQNINAGANVYIGRVIVKPKGL